MAKPGPARGIKLTQEHRDKIANSKILQRLIDFAEGVEGVEMEPHRVTAALGLLKKVMPDMTESMIKGEGDGGALKIELIRLADRPAS